MHDARYVEQKQSKIAITATERVTFVQQNLMNHNTNLHWDLHNLWILPDIEENKPSIAYSNACFFPHNYTIYGNSIRISESPRTRREVTLAVVVLISVLIGALIASTIETQMLSYNQMINKKLEDLEDKFTLQLNQVEDQVSELQVQQIELVKAIATLSRVTANLANRQPLQKQIVTTKRSIKNRNRNLIKQNFTTKWVKKHPWIIIN